MLPTTAPWRRANLPSRICAGMLLRLIRGLCLVQRVGREVRMFLLANRRLVSTLPMYYGWVIVVVSALANISRVSAAVEVLSVFIPALVAEFGWSRTLVSSSVFFGSLAGAAVSPVGGYLVDRFGSRFVIIVGALMVAVGCFSLSFTQGAVMFIAAYTLIRMAAQGLIYVATPVAVANWFIRRRGTALAVLFAISSGGLLIAPVLVQSIINVGSWRTGWLVLGTLALALGCIPALLFILRRPEDVGLEADGDVPVGPSADVTTKQIRVSTEDWTAREAVRTPALWMIVVAAFLVNLMLSGVGLHQMPFYLESGLNPTVSAMVIGTFAAGMILGSTVWGWTADRISPRSLLIATYLGGACLMALLLSVKGTATAFSFSFLFGFIVGGASLTLPTVLLGSYYGRTSLGSIQGVLQGVRVLGLAVGPMIAGRYYDVTQSYIGAFVSFGILAVLASLLMVLCRHPRRLVIARQ